jgi:hypothetical protein
VSGRFETVGKRLAKRKELYYRRKRANDAALGFNWMNNTYTEFDENFSNLTLTHRNSPIIDTIINEK